MFGFIGRHWRGDAGFWLSLLVFSVALTAVLNWAIVYAQVVYSLEAAPHSRIILNVVLNLLLAAFAVWQLVGTWRASSFGKAPGRWLVTRWVARLAALAAAAIAVLFLSFVPRGLSQLQALASGTDDISKDGYTLTVDDDQMTIGGRVTWGLYDEVAKALDGNSNIQTVVLNSTGGIVPAGLRIAGLIKARKLDTLTTGNCMSACTVAFVAGERRLLRKGAKLGFHSEAEVFKDGGEGNAPDLLTRLSKEHTTAYWRAAGVPEDFISRIFATPPAEMWFPTNDELREANIVTDVVK